MIKLKRIKLNNYCGYKDFELDLTDEEGKIKKWLILYGPNGAFKSSFLNAVDLLACSYRIRSRPDPTAFLQKSTYNKDYTKAKGRDIEDKQNMYIEGIFDDTGEEKKVTIENKWHWVEEEQGNIFTGKFEKVTVQRWDPKTSGVTYSDFPFTPFEATFYCDADNPLNLNKFQLHAEYGEDFLKFVEDVYGLKCEFPEKCIVVDSGNKYINDFIIYKKGNTRVHFGSFSDGEKKIATLIAQLFNHSFQHNGDEHTLFLIDNIEQHIYFLRHMNIIKNINKYFPDNQIIATTHSPIIIENTPKKNLLCMEEFYYDEVLDETGKRFY